MFVYWIKFVVLGCIIPYNGVIPDPTKEVIAMEFSPCAAEFICVAGLDAAPTDDGQGEIGRFEKASDLEFRVYTLVWVFFKFLFTLVRCFDSFL